MENATQGDGMNDRLESWRQAILDLMLASAPFDGWTQGALVTAARDTGGQAGFDGARDLDLAFPGGVGDVLALWTETGNAALAEKYAAADPAPERIRDKVRFLVQERIRLLEPRREAARRATATLALPQFTALSARLTWSVADTIWRLLGDTSTDFNYYTKRTTLSAVYLSTLARWFAEEPEEGEDFTASWAFLDDRIENVMQFEKVKARVRKLTPDPNELFTQLGRLRYGTKL